MEFEPFPKTPRLSRDMTVTEKIDGTNASVWVIDYRVDPIPTGEQVPFFGDYAIMAGSRTRFVFPHADNFGFAAWVWEHAEELVELGAGVHHGEWWGQGIQRKYGLKEKRFSLFNTNQWGEERPECCHVVPVLYQGMFYTESIEGVMTSLRQQGSSAAPGFDKPEGVVIWHHGAYMAFKKTFEGDEKGKGS